MKPAGDEVAELASSEAISWDGGCCGGRFTPKRHSRRLAGATGLSEAVWAHWMGQNVILCRARRST